MADLLGMIKHLEKVAVEPHSPHDRRSQQAGQQSQSTGKSRIVRSILSITTCKDSSLATSLYLFIFKCIRLFAKEGCSVIYSFFPECVPCLSLLFLGFCLKFRQKLSTLISQIRLNIKCLITCVTYAYKSKLSSYAIQMNLDTFQLHQIRLHRQLYCLFIFLSPPAIPALYKFKVFMSLIPHVFLVLWNYVLPR